MGKKGTAGGGKSTAKEGGQSTQENKEGTVVVAFNLCVICPSMFARLCYFALCLNCI